MKLRQNEYCPIHRSLFSCGRGSQGAAEEWTAFRSMDAQLSENIDPAASPAAYREAPTELPKIFTTAAQAHDRVTDWIRRAAVGRSDHEKNRWSV